MVDPFRVTDWDVVERVPWVFIAYTTLMVVSVPVVLHEPPPLKEEPSVL